jgi:WD40 repeat protein
VLGELAGHSRHVTCVRFSPTGQILASTSGDDTIKLWDMCALDQGAARNRCLQTLQSPGPYTGMDITGVTGISEAQKAALKALGAVEG